ncbi:murein biosynthesis integral membrane protein MurJ [Spirilliplanes yamanashiensis]|uniref:Peptidoglycan lipid II flippase n=1 Tax=Spirilliplanes yamanashiensis TaxID=42233 RepID=A0A8J4DLU3_9ACTN|nr:lipid II flippase MurJ [Spirilliplanes yamanashiensis]MDP9818545.1 putative peptidoglycan lipid II flippase [Spirilliplanes yamanashiensis]GIJ06326.1 hypothetical protein Sya03_56780 [Spirilliplanes yamanashiensis]
MTAAPAAARIAGAATLIAGLTVLARLAGFGRTLVFLQTVGANDLGDLYLAANTVPNILFELVAGGALASLVVPLLAGAVAAGDIDRVRATASALLGWTLLLLVPLAALVALLAHPVVSVLAADLSPAATDTAARMLRVFAVQLPLYGVGVVLTGVLQAHRRFAWPVIAPLLSSVTVIAAYVAYAAVDGPRTGAARLSTAGEYLLSAGTTLGVVVLSLCLLVPLRGLRLRLRPALRFPPGVARRTVRLGWAGAVTVGAQQVVLALVIALSAGAGTYTLFNAAWTVFLLPWAVLAVPVATAVYPALAAAHDGGDADGYRQALSRTGRSVVLLCCLGAAALAAVAGPAARLMGVPGAAGGIAWLAPGLLGYGLYALLSRALYARGNPAAVAGAVAAGWAAVAAGALLLVTVVPDRVAALAAAHSAGLLLLGLLLAVAVRRHAGAGSLARLGRVTLVGVAAGLLGAAAGRLVASALAGPPAAAPGAVAALVAGLLAGLTVLVVFAAVALAAGRHDVRPVAAGLLRRVSRRRAAPDPVPHPVASSATGPAANLRTDARPPGTGADDDGQGER